MLRYQPRLVPREWALGPHRDLAKGSLAHSCLPSSAGESPRDRLLSDGFVSEQEPWPEATRSDQSYPLSTALSQLLLRAPVYGVRAQAFLSKESSWGPQVPRLLGCLGAPLTLQWGEGCTPKSSVPTVSLAEGRGKKLFLWFLLLKGWRERLGSGFLPPRKMASSQGSPWTRNLLSTCSHPTSLF